MQNILPQRRSPDACPGCVAVLEHFKWSPDLRRLCTAGSAPRQCSRPEIAVVPAVQNADKIAVVEEIRKRAQSRTFQKAVDVLALLAQMQPRPRELELLPYGTERKSIPARCLTCSGHRPCTWDVKSLHSAHWLNEDLNSARHVRAAEASLLKQELDMPCSFKTELVQCRSFSVRNTRQQDKLTAIHASLCRYGHAHSGVSAGAWLYLEGGGGETSGRAGA